MICAPPFALTTPPKHLFLDQLFTNRNTILMSDGLLACIGRNVLGVLASGSFLIPVSMVISSASSIAVPVSIVPISIVPVSIGRRHLSEIPEAVWSGLAVFWSACRWPSDLSRHHLALAVVQSQVQHVLP